MELQEDILTYTHFPGAFPVLIIINAHRIEQIEHNISQLMPTFAYFLKYWANRLFRYLTEVRSFLILNLSSHSKICMFRETFGGVHYHSQRGFEIFKDEISIEQQVQISSFFAWKVSRYGEIFR